MTPDSLTTLPWTEDSLHEECALFGVFGATEAASPLVALGLHALQHRGQEASGVVSFNGSFHVHRAMGHVAGNFDQKDVIDRLPGGSAIGHNRYATTGDTVLRNVQPLFAELSTGGFAVAHNGNITNAAALRRQLVKQGSIFQSTTDTEVISHLVATSTFRTLLDRIVDALRRIEGAYSLVCLTGEAMIGVRDPLGVRPLVLGRVGEAYILSSETCGLDIVGADYLRDVEPGELIVISSRGLQSHFPFPRVKARPCIFEHVYFSRPDSVYDGRSVYDVRKRIGAELARESGVEADVVVPVPDSGTPAAIGYAQQSGISFELGIIRSHYVGRTFIQPGERIRHLGVKLKHNANRIEIAGKRIVLIDDSIVRGTTSKKIVELLRDAGAREIHMRIASPPTRHSCFYGVDTPDRSKLLAAQMDIAAMQRFIEADSLAFLSIDGLYRAVGEQGRDNGSPQYCDACFTGNYPTPLTDQDDLDQRDQLMLMADHTI